MAKKMRILQILPELNVGGVETGTVDFAMYLHDHGYHSVVVSNGGELVPELEGRGIRHYALPVHRKNLFAVMSCVKKLRRIILDEKIDIVHARSRVPAWIAFFACRRTPAQFLTTCHGHYSVQIFSRIMAFSKLIIVPSQVIGRHMIDHFHFPPENVRCIPRSVDLEKFSAVRQDDLGRSQSVITIVGRLTPLKGHAYFLKAMARVVRSAPYVKILIVGDAPKKKEYYRQELEVLTRHLGLSEHVEFLGKRKDIPQIMAASDVVVMSSIEPEAFGRVIIEAQAAGTPVVATSVGGIVEVVEHEKTGLLVLPKDIDAMAGAVLRVLNDKKLARDLVSAARRRLEEEFTLEKMAERTIRVYEELMEQLNILIIKMTALGDVILLTPSLRAIRRRYPQARICCLTDERSREILQRCPHIDELIVIDLKDRDRGTLGAVRFSRRLSRYHFDKVIDFQNNRTSHLLGWLCFARHTYGYRNKKWGFLLTDPVINPDHSLPAVKHQFQILNMLDIPYPEDDRIEVYPSAKDRQAAAQMMEAEWISQAMKVVGIHISASENWKTKNWPAESIAKLCDVLMVKNIRVILTGTAADRPLADQIMSMTRAKPANFTGKTGIMELAAVIERCHVYITPDSSPLHIAAAVGTPVIALFGPTSSHRHMPPNRRSLVIQKGLNCSPCYNGKFCKTLGHACMTEISVDEVRAGIERLLAEPDPSRCEEPAGRSDKNF